MVKYGAYVDGSYNAKTHMYGGAYQVVNHQNNSFSGNKPQFVGSRNVAGECGAVMLLLTDMYQAGLLRPDVELNIFYDYAGIEHWITGAWKTNSAIAKSYKKVVRQFVDTTGIVIVFNKVKAHSGDVLNDIVDGLAKEAVGIK